MLIDISKFSENILKKKSVVGVLGLGQVGLPTALCVLNANYQVIGIDKNKKIIDQLSAGRSPLPESGLEDLINKYISNNYFQVSLSVSTLSEADIIIICVPTPLNNLKLNADLSYLIKALSEISSLLNRPKLIIIESTIPPNTLKNIIVPYLEKESDKKAGKDFLISYCPERISPGNSLEEFTNNARTIGADDPNSLQVCNLFFENIMKGKILLSKSISAELSKLAENSFRDLNIAFANELAIICEQSGADILDVIRLANTHPRVNIHLPGPGVGGPCLPKDPYLLISDQNFNSSLIKLARNTNDSMPNHVVKTLLEVIDSSQDLRKFKILILGVSYKPGVNDTRYSPTYNIVNKLKEHEFETIFVHDPYTLETFGASSITENLNSILTNFDCIITVTAHPQYKELDPSLFKDNSIIVDAARIFDKHKFANRNITFLALGSR